MELWTNFADSCGLPSLLGIGASLCRYVVNYLLHRLCSSFHDIDYFAEDWQATIDEKKAALQASAESGSINKIEKEKQHMLNNDISVDSQDGDSIENQTKDRTTIYTE
jgi:hypothetical protein